MKTACAYIRVSTDKQEELSPDAQRRLLIDFAKNNSMLLLEENIYIDNGISGKKADKRPEFMKMIGLAKSKEHPFDIILVWKFSRFARNQEESVVYKSLLKKNDVDVVSVSEPLVDGPFGTLIERIIEWMDEYYSIRLSGEVLRGMTEKALRGGYQSALPIGYSMDKENGIPRVNDKINIVKLIYNDFDKNGMTCLEIARKLNNMGYRTTKGKMFEYRTVKYILENPFYAGKVRWNRQNHESHTIKNKCEWIVADGKHEAVFTQDYFEYIQKLMAKRSRPYKARTTGTKHWLSGMVKCSKCGASLGIKRTGTSTAYFNCLNYTKGSCSESHYITQKKLETAVKKAFREVLTWGDDMHFEINIKSVHERTVDSDAIIREQLATLDNKEKRIKEAYMVGIDSIEEYKENRMIIANERKHIEEELKSIHKASDNKSCIKEEITSIYDIITSEDIDNRKKANALKSVVDHIVYDKKNDEIQIFLYILKSV